MSDDLITITPGDAAALRSLARRLVALKDRDAFARLQARIAEEVVSLAQGLNAGALTPDDWQREMAELLIAGHIAAAQDGLGRNDLPPSIREELSQIVGEQITYLNRFADQIAADGWADRYLSRAQLYVKAMGASYEVGASDRIKLPAYPRDGSTQCLSNCKCRWRIVWVNREKGSADCYWELSQAEHCPDCTKRARLWNPLRVRRGIIQE